MILGRNQIILSVLLALVSVIGIQYAMNFLTMSEALGYLQKLAFTSAAFIAAATYLRGKLSDLINDDNLSLEETRRLTCILVVRRNRLSNFLLGCTVITVFLGIAPFLVVAPEKLLIVVPHFLVAGFVELLYFFALIVISIDEVEKFKDKLVQRAKEDKEREALLKKLEET